MNNLKAIAGGDRSLGPLGAWDDLSIMFNGYAVGFEPQGGDYAGQIGR
jgi:hypothetical protein